MLAVFLDLQQAYDRVRVDVAIHRLSRMGLTGRITRYLHNYLTGRTFAVKFGSILSSPRPLIWGFPQVSTLSPILFNVALVDMVPASLRDGITVSTTMYADDLCIWADSTQMRPLSKVIHATLDELSAKLERI